MLRRSYTSAAAAHTHGRPRRGTRDPRRCNGHPRPLPGAARRAAPLSANACSTALVARARLPQAACCTAQGVGHDVSPCSGLPGAALGSGGAWRGARLLPGPSVRTRVGPLTARRRGRCDGGRAVGLVRCVRRHAVQQRDDPTLGLREIHTCTQVLSHIKLATLRPHSAVHEQTTSLQPPPKGLPISLSRGGG